MREHNEQTFDRDSLTASNRALYDACELLESRADVAPGEWFSTTRVALIVESNLPPMTQDCSVYCLERDGIIERNSRRGVGTRIRILRRAA